MRNRLKVLRAERDWSQAELGGRLGVSRQAVNAIETGKHDPSLPLAFKIARLFAMPTKKYFSSVRPEAGATEDMGPAQQAQEASRNRFWMMISGVMHLRAGVGGPHVPSQ